jgi:AcrR family transcriptional regulator
MNKASDNDRRVMRSKKAIKQSLAELCKTKSALFITVSDIVENAGYSRGTFYAHYNSKEDFFISIIDEEINDYIKVVFGALGNTTGAKVEDDIFISVLSLFEHVYENRVLYYVILSDKLLSQTTDYFCNKVSGAIHASLDFTVNDSSIDLDIMSYAKINHYLCLIKYWMNNDFKYSAQYMAEQDRFYYTSAVRGVSAKKKRG